MNILSVGIGEIKISNSPDDVLIAYGLGSCIGVLLYDPEIKLAGAIHVLLANSSIDRVLDNPAKFADTGIPLLLSMLEAKGGIKSRYKVAIAGGAQMFNIPFGKPEFNIGLKNSIAVKEALAKAGLNIARENTGGKEGKTIKLFVKDGKMTYKTPGKEDTEF